MSLSTDPPRVKLGPVIGKVTHNSARILVEFDKEAEVACYITSSRGQRLESRIKSKSDRPVAFSFTGLEPKTYYTVTLSVKLDMKSSFWTLRENTDNPGNLKAAIISCNEISHSYNKSKESDLWFDLCKRVDAHEFDYIFHIGDQCYMDMGDYGESKEDPYRVCMFILKSTPKELWDTKRPALLEVLRAEYRKTWSYYPISYTLANIPNITICDDHELRDDWGFREEDYTPGTMDYLYGQLARQVYYEYQRQLREDIPWDNLASLKCEYYENVFHGVGVSIMEFRGCRSWFREQGLDETHIGKNQLEWIKSLYGQGGKFENVNSALFITPLPMFFLAPSISKLAFHVEDDIQEHWSFGHMKQMKVVLDLLRLWKERRNGREITIVGGDVHVGGYTDVYYEDKPVFKQLVSSAINGHAVNKVEEAILKGFQTLGKLSNGYSFKHHGWTRENNFGIIDVVNVNGVSHVTNQLILSDQKKRIKEADIDLNDDFKRAPACGGCNMF